MPTDAAALPIYMQVSGKLIREISSGRLIDGEKLPPERDMAADLGIAVGTLRKALNDLVAKGLLDRVQGSGNYVRHNPDAADDYAFFRIELLNGGGLPTADVLSVRRIKKPSELPDFGRSGYGHRIRRLRLLSGVPAALEEIWLDGNWVEELKLGELTDSLYFFYRKSLGLLISNVKDRIGTGTTPDWSVPEFGCGRGEVTGFVERWGRTADGETAEYSRTWFDPKQARYVARIM